MNKAIVVLLFLCLVACKQEHPIPVKTIINPVTVQNEPPKSIYTMDELLGKIDEKKHGDFIKIPTAFTDKKNIYLRKEALDSFTEMRAAAAKENVKLLIRSATRNFDYQKRIWEAKWNGTVQLSDGSFATSIKDPVSRAKKILQYSSMPGSSRHHWGTDIDLNAFNNDYFGFGDGKKEYDWLSKNAANYGFYRPYTEKGANRPNGYNEEKWHWSYLPKAKQFTDQAKHQLKDEMISGFDGEEVAPDVQMVKNYVLGIDPSCL